MQTWVAGILAALIVAGIGATVVVYGDVGKHQTDLTGLRRDMDKLEARANVYGEAVARLEEQMRCTK